MATVFIDPTATAPGNGSLAQPYVSWDQVVFRPGDTYVQRAGTTTFASLTIEEQGSAEAPIVIGRYGEGAAPVIDGMINLNGAAFVTVFGLALRNAGFASISIHDGAHSNTIVGNTMSASLMGVWIGNGAGGDNVVAMNEIRDASLVGISVAEVASPDGHPGIIANNTVTGSGAHGIGLNGNGFIVLGNRVTGSGQSVPGSSGIHVFGGFEGAPDGFGVGNAIVGNVVDGSRDVWTYDGNGIQLDQYTHGNIVLGNFVTGNDGAGIILYDSYANAVMDNVAEGNQRDSGGSHPIRADMLLMGSMDITDGNFISGNVGLSASGPAVLVDAATADNANLFTGNVWQNSGGGADTTLGLDLSWAGWLANPLTGGAGMTPDAETGVTLVAAGAAEALAYGYAAGTVLTIDGLAREVLGWNDGHLVVSGEAVM